MIKYENVKDMTLEQQQHIYKTTFKITRTLTIDYIINCCPSFDAFTDCIKLLAMGYDVFVSQTTIRAIEVADYDYTYSFAKDGSWLEPPVEAIPKPKPDEGTFEIKTDITYELLRHALKNNLAVSYRSEVRQGELCKETQVDIGKME